MAQNTNNVPIEGAYSTLPEVVNREDYVSTLEFHDPHNPPYAYTDGKQTLTSEYLSSPPPEVWKSSGYGTKETSAIAELAPSETHSGIHQDGVLQPLSLDEANPNRQTRNFLGFRVKRKTFLFLIVALVVILAAVIGGVVGGVVGAQSKSRNVGSKVVQAGSVTSSSPVSAAATAAASSTSGNSTSSDSSSTTQTASSADSTVQSSMISVGTVTQTVTDSSAASATSAASSSSSSGSVSGSSSSTRSSGIGYLPLSATTCESSGGTNIILVNQISNGDLYMKGYWQTGGWASNWTLLGVDTAPMKNTPLTSICFYSSSEISIRIYYLAEDSTLKEITTSCSVSGSCGSIKTGTPLTTALVSTAGISAGWLIGRGINIFTITSDGVIAQITWQSGSGWSGPVALSGLEADTSSPLAAAFANPDLSGATEVIRLFWYGTSGALQTVTYNASTWSDVSVLDGSSTSSALAAVLTLSHTSSLVFTLPDSVPSQRTFVSSFGSAASSSVWTDADSTPGPLAAVSWGTNTLRMYYPSGNEIQEFAGSSSGWKKASGLGLPSS